MDTNNGFRTEAKEMMDNKHLADTLTTAAFTELQTADLQLQNEVVNEASQTDDWSPYIEVIENGVINIKIESSFQVASDLVERVSKPTQAVVGKPKDISDGEGSEDGDVTSEACDWSFVQEWRAR